MACRFSLAMPTSPMRISLRARSSSVGSSVAGEGSPKLAAAAKIAGVRRFVLVSVFPEAWRERHMPQDFESYMAEKKNVEPKLVLTELD